MAREKREAHPRKAVFRRLTYNFLESVTILALKSSLTLTNKQSLDGCIVIEREVTPREYRDIISAGVITGIFLATSARDTKEKGQMIGHSHNVTQRQRS